MTESLSLAEKLCIITVTKGTTTQETKSQERALDKYKTGVGVIKENIKCQIKLPVRSIWLIYLI